MTWRIGSIGDPRDPVTVLEADDRLVRLDSVLEPGSVPGDGDRSVRALLEDWETWHPRLAAAANQAGGAEALDRDQVEWLPPVCFPRKLIICGANYRQHVAEMGDDPDAIKSPFTLQKPASTSPIGAGRPIVLPELAEWVDWEGELGVVIGRRARHVAAADALGVVAGFLPVNDVSARDWVDKQVPGVGMNWTLHKGFDGFTPAGPLLTPAEFVDDPQDLRIVLTVNGVVKQDASTAEMIFPVTELIAHLSSVMTLEPGDMLLTGSPSGSGFARSPRERLQAGDVVAVKIDGLGELLNPVVAHAPE
jgi:2,4-diketo-3-deoxy-L-fuconate hydrolase